jgi:mono/diheme cytochrome c family protein
MKRSRMWRWEAGIVLFAFGMMISGCAEKHSAPSQIERGKYLVLAGGCNDCHTPKVFTAAGPAFDTTRLLSGYPAGTVLPEFPKAILGPEKWGAVTTNDLTAWAGPWGVSFAYNLTPDTKTGIGGWTEEMFINTLRTGKFMGMSRDILPPMPWQTIGQMTDDDLKAMFAYLKSLPPIENSIPAPLPPQ